MNRIFSRVVFLERKLGVSVFSSLFMWGGTSPVGSDLEWQSQRKNHFKMGFPFCRRSFTSPKIYLVRRPSVLFLSFLYWSRTILFSSDLFPFYFLPIFDRESFFSFSFLSFHFFLFISSFSFLSLLFFDLWLEIWVLAFVIRFPLTRFCCPLLRGEGWGFSSWAKVQGSWRLCLLFTVRAQFWYLGQNKFMCQGVGFGLNSHIISTRHA